MLEKNKEQEKEPSILPLSVPSTSMWFPLLPVTAPVSKTSLQVNKNQKDFKVCIIYTSSWGKVSLQKYPNKKEASYWTWTSKKIVVTFVSEVMVCFY